MAPERLSLAAATELLSAVFRGADVPEAAARSVAAALVAAEAEGQVGHGFARVADYVAQARSGKVRARAEVRSDHAQPGRVTIDAGFGFAYPALDAAFDVGTGICRTQGITLISIGNSHHCGALSVQVERYAKAGLLCLMVANTPKAMAPWGGSEPVFGTNPIAFAAPTDGPPLVIDLSLSVVARGKVMAARKSGRAIPEGWALDASGQPTTDPEAALAGSMAPIGGPKGTALALMVELLAGALTGSAFSHEAASFFGADGPPPGTGQTLILIRPDTAFASRARALLELVAAQEGVRLPGQRRRDAIARSEAQGLDIAPGLLAEIRALAGP